jgi:phosphatidylserine/phosphatidylglycerophosphate/cardiolipin synthase-like enzyme
MVRKNFTHGWLVCLLISVGAVLLAGDSGLYAAQKGTQGKVTLLRDHTYFDALIHGIRNARKEIVGCFFLFKVNERQDNLPQKVAEELIAAKMRGVDISIEMERDVKGKGTVYEQNRHAAKLLTDAGVKVRFDAPKTITHVKALVVDGRYVYIGSHNLTHSALKYNNELSVMIDSPELAREVTDYLKGL